MEKITKEIPSQRILGIAEDLNYVYICEHDIYSKFLLLKVGP